MVDRVALAGSQVALHQHVDGATVLGMHHDQAAVLRGPAHRLKDCRVVEHEDPGISHEELEGRDAFVDQRVHLLEDRVVDLAHDHVEAVVDVRLALRFLVPLVEALAQRLAEGLHRKVDDRRRPAPGGRRASGGEVIGGEGATEGQLHVGVDIDRARHHVAVLGVDHLIGVGRQSAPDGRDLFTLDQHVGLVGVARRHHRAVLDQRPHGSSLTSSS